jgi:hypothetical protein
MTRRGVTVKSVFVVLVSTAISAGGVEAQILPVDTPPPAPVQKPAEPPPPVVTSPTPAPPAPAPVPAGPVSAPAALAAPAPAPLSAALIERRREAIKEMEVLLAQRVRSGAERIGKQMQAIDPAALILSGSLRARGFILEGYGVFFDVEIPSVQPSVAWYMRALQREQLAPPPGASPLAGTQRASETIATAEEFLADPDRHYVETIRSALIYAMLEYSKPMELQPNEWFTVAARDSGGPVPGQFGYDPPTMMIRVRGSDLADYLAGRLTAEEVRKKVEVRKF